jgi:hypothetical protein
VDGSVFVGIQKAIVADRYAFFSEVFKNFYNTDLLLGKRVSEQAVQASWNVAAGASATACLACVPAWHEDFCKDLTRGRRAHLGHSRGRGPNPTYQCLGASDRQTDQGSPAIGGEGRAALHHMDPRRRSKPRAGELPGRAGEGCRFSAPERSSRINETFVALVRTIGDHGKTRAGRGFAPLSRRSKTTVSGGLRVPDYNKISKPLTPAE